MKVFTNNRDYKRADVPELLCRANFLKFLYNIHDNFESSVSK